MCDVRNCRKDAVHVLMSDSSIAAGAGGCFAGDATVRLSTGQQKTMDNITVGDRVLTYDARTKQFHYDPVVTFLHRSRETVQKTQFLTVDTEYGHRLTLTPGTHSSVMFSQRRSV